jgi:tRNA modification GTPase
MLDVADTIAAIASPAGPALRGIVRLSGPRAWDIALAAFLPDGPAARTHQPVLRQGRIRLATIGREMAAAIALWPGPRTYTGQPLAEIHTVGSPPLLQRVLADCLLRGARLAEPGEFTLRAFLNGQIDLTRAEAVLGVIDARSPAQLDLALKQLAGGLAGSIRTLRDRLLDLLAHLEAGLDFVEEEDVDPIQRAALADEVAAASAAVGELAHRLQARDRPEGRPRVVLVGPPNAGKSRLFNALLGEAQALVSPVAGTTRDYLTAPCDCGGLPVELIDTAGAEPAGDEIAARAQELREEVMMSADLLLVCEPHGAAIVADPAVAATRLLVGTKADLGPIAPGWLPTSAETGVGLDRLRTAIASTLRADPREAAGVAATGARCGVGLARAAEALEEAAATLARGGGDELVALDLREALEELGRVVGEVVTDDILDRIFSRFCVGK